MKIFYLVSTISLLLFAISSGAQNLESIFDRKLRATLSSSYNTSYTNSQRVSTILNGCVNGSYTIQKKHNSSLSLVAVNRESKSETSAQSFTEFTERLVIVMPLE